MNCFKTSVFFSSLLFVSLTVFAQNNLKISKLPAENATIALKSSPAYAEIALRRTELRAEVESLLITYTEEFPKVRESRFELDVLDKELIRLLSVKPADSVKLTLALGKLIVRKAELETDFWSLQKKYGDEHPEVKRARRKVEIYENSIKEILN